MTKYNVGIVIIEGRYWLVEDIHQMIGLGGLQKNDKPIQTNFATVSMDDIRRLESVYHIKDF